MDFWSSLQEKGKKIKLASYTWPGLYSLCFMHAVLRLMTLKHIKQYFFFGNLKHTDVKTSLLPLQPYPSYCMCFSYTGVSYFIELHFTMPHRQFIFYKLKVFGSLHCMEQFYWCHFFPAAFAHFMPLCLLLVILAHFKLLHSYYICYSDL